MICLNYSTDCFSSRFTVLTRKFSLDQWPKWADKIRLEMAKLASFTPSFKWVTVFSRLLGNGKHFPFLYFKRTVVIPLDYTGNRNFYRHRRTSVEANHRPTLVFYCCTISYWLSIQSMKINDV